MEGEVMKKIMETNFLLLIFFIKKKKEKNERYLLLAYLTYTQPN